MIKHSVAILVIILTASTTIFSQTTEADNSTDSLNNISNKIYQLFAKLEKAGNGKAAADCFNSISSAYVYVDLDSSLYYANVALSVSEEEFYKKGEADAYKNFGVINFRSGNYTESIVNLSEALEAYDKYGYSNEKAECHALIAKVYALQEDPYSAIVHLEESMKTNNPGDLLMYEILSAYSLYYFSIDEPDKAEPYYEKAKIAAEKINSLNMLGELAAYRKSYYHKKMLENLDELGFKKS